MISKKPSIDTKKTGTSQLEFILLMACLMSIVALSIDTILPALKPIGLSVGTTSAGENQLLITMIFLGLGFGQLILGHYQIVLEENLLFTLGLQYLYWLVFYVLQLPA